jgi:hypothetical protein
VSGLLTVFTSRLNAANLSGSMDIVLDNFGGEGAR